MQKQFVLKEMIKNHQPVLQIYIQKLNKSETLGGDNEPGCEINNFV